jgi:MFS family permease
MSRLIVCENKAVKKNSATLVMIAGALAYLMTVTNRSSMGVASLLASQRFDVAATALSTLAVAQLVVYAAMQIPVGILLDRFGSRSMLVFGTVVMTIGQFLVSIAEEIGFAVVGRMFVGLGDAFVFISVIRLVNGWYVGARATRIQQLVTNTGQLGQAVSAIPFAFLLADFGWNVSFMILAGLSLTVVFVSAAFVVNDRNSTAGHGARPALKQVTKQLFENIRHPGVRMAFWTHFVLQSAPSVFSLLWGYPFLVGGQGMEPYIASLLLSSFVLVGFLVGPLISNFCAKYPQRRSFLILLNVVALGITWSLVIFLPGRAPAWLVAVLCLVLAVSGPMSMIAMDYTRSFISKHRLGTAIGFVNIGGFLATFSMMFLAGLILDLVKATSEASGIAVELYSLNGFKWAMSVQFLILILGTCMFLLERRKARAKLLLDEGIRLRPIGVVIAERITSRRR